MKTIVEPHNIRGFEIELEKTTQDSDVQVFPPTLRNGVTGLIADNMVVDPGDTVIGIGAGTGVLEILAAKLGALKVYAGELQPEACYLARRNAERNGVASIVDVREGSLFDPFAGIEADVIIADVAGIPADLADKWYPPGVPRAGGRGSELTVRAIKESPRHLLEKGRLYVPTGTITDQKSVLDAAYDTFGKKNVTSLKLRDGGETKHLIFPRDMLEGYERWRHLVEEGIVKLFYRAGQKFEEVKENIEAYRNKGILFYQFRLLEAVKLGR